MAESARSIALEHTEALWCLMLTCVFVSAQMSMCLLRDRWWRTQPVPTGHTQEYKMQIKSITLSTMLALDNLLFSKQ